MKTRKCFIAGFLAALLLTLLTGCATNSWQEGGYYFTKTIRGDSSLITVTGQNTGSVYELSFTNGEIAYGSDRYGYTCSYQNRIYTVGITYPDGYKHETEYMKGSGVITLDSYLHYGAENPYLSEDVLIPAIALNMSGGKSGIHIHAGVMLAGIGITALGFWCALRPKDAYYMNEGWQYKNVEPSELKLGATALYGVLAIVGGLVLFVVSLFVG